MKTKPFSELRNKMTPEQKAKSQILGKVALLHLKLVELQHSLGLTPEEIEADFDKFEATISDLENQENIELSTLSHYIYQSTGRQYQNSSSFPQ